MDNNECVRMQVTHNEGERMKVKIWLDAWEEVQSEGFQSGMKDDIFSYTLEHKPHSPASE